jgi:hypothetical protein
MEDKEVTDVEKIAINKFSGIITKIKEWLESKKLKPVVITDGNDAEGAIGYQFLFKNIDGKEVANIESTYTQSDRIECRPHTGPVTRDSRKKKRKHDNIDNIDNIASTLYISWISVVDSEQGNGYGLLILIYCICYINSIHRIQVASLEDMSKKAGYICSLYHKVRFMPLSTELLQLDMSNSKKFQTTGGPELLLDLTMKGDYADMLDRLISSRYPKPVNIEIDNSDKDKLDKYNELEKELVEFAVEGERFYNAVHTLASVRKAATRWREAMKKKRRNMEGGSARAAKYTLKELKDIAVSNKIKITKKIDNKTLYLNKADLIKKLKKHGYYTICRLGEKDREINCGHSSPTRRPIIGDRAAKYTLKELKDIAVSNKIKITKKIDNKTLYLNKADLIKKLKKHKLL